MTKARYKDNRFQYDEGPSENMHTSSKHSRSRLHSFQDRMKKGFIKSYIEKNALRMEER